MTNFINGSTTTNESETEIGNIYEKSVEKATQSQAAVDSNDRMIFFNENYRKRQAEYNLLLFYLLLGFFVFLILVAIKRFFPVIPSSFMNFLIAILFLIILVVIAYKYFDIQRRYVLNFDEVDIPNNIALDNDINSKGALSAINQGKLSDLIASGSSAKLFNLPYGYKLDENRNVVLDTDNFRIETDGYIVPKVIPTTDTLTTTSKNCICMVNASGNKVTDLLPVSGSGTFVPTTITYSSSKYNAIISGASATNYYMIIKRNGIFNLPNFLTTDINDYKFLTDKPTVLTTLSVTTNIIQLCTTTSISALNENSPTVVNGHYIYFIKESIGVSGPEGTASNAKSNNIGIYSGPFFILHH